MSMIYDDPGVCTKTSCIQVFYGLWVNMAEIGIGMTVGFSAVAVPQLKESESFMATVNELTWIASVLTLSSPLGSLACGLLVDRIGRRMMQVISQLPMAVGWWYTALSTTPTHLIIGRVITGIGVGMSSGPIRIYTTEISLANMRGVLGAFNNTATAIGITVTAAMGAILKWTTHCYICGLFSAFLMIINFFLPETPYHVLMKDSTNNYIDTRRALQKFRSKKHDIDGEMERLIDYKTENEIRRTSLWQKIISLFQVSACKPFFIIMPYILVAQCSGISIMMFWTIDILEASNLDLDTYLCNIGLGVTRIIFGLFTSVLMYYVGRRPLAIISAIGLSMVCFATGGYLMSASSPGWYPLLGYTLYMLFSSLGFYFLPLLIMFELYPLLLRGFLGGITVSLASLFIFSSNTIYPYMKDSIGLANTFFIFGVFSLLGSIFLCISLPETKGLTLQEIEEYYNKKRPTLTSERKVYSAQWLSRSQNAISSSITTVNKTKSLDHHKASPTHLAHTGRKLDTVSEDLDLHHPVHEAPNIDFNSDEDIKDHKKHDKQKTIKVKTKTDNDNAESSIISIDSSQRDSFSLMQERQKKYKGSNKNANIIKTESNKNLSGARAPLDLATDSSITSGRVSINPVVTQSGKVELTKNVESVRSVESARSTGPSRSVEPSKSAESTRSVGPSRIVEPSRSVESTRKVRPSRTVEPSSSVDSTRSIPSTSVEPTTKDRRQDQKSTPRSSTDSNISGGSNKRTKQERKDIKRHKKSKSKENE